MLFGVSIFQTKRNRKFSHVVGQFPDAPHRENLEPSTTTNTLGVHVTLRATSKRTREVRNVRNGAGCKKARQRYVIMTGNNIRSGFSATTKGMLRPRKTEVPFQPNADLLNAVMPLGEHN